MTIMKSQISPPTTGSIETIGSLARCSCCSVSRPASFTSSKNLTNKRRYFGVSVKASHGYDDSSTYLVQSDSLTSCEANGCGVTCEGGGRAGKPCVKNFPEAIRNVGSKDGYSCCGARREKGIEGSVEMA